MFTNEGLELSLTLKAPTEVVYRALTTQEGIQGWWTQVCRVTEAGSDDSSARPTVEARFPRAGFHAVMRVDAAEPGKLLEWTCTDSKHPESSGFVDLHDWVNTRVEFRLAPADEGTELTVKHLGLTPKLECYDQCETAWKFFVTTSLRGYVERGQGEPYLEADPA